MAIVTVSEAMGRWAKFNEIGDKVEGVVVEYSPHTGTNNYKKEECGYLTLDGGDSVHKVELSKVDLIDKVARALPSPGRWMSITFVAEKPLPGRKPMKVFEVKYDDETGDGTPPVQATVAHGDQLDGGDLPF